MISLLFLAPLVPTGKKRALIIANSKYRHAKNQLKYAVDNGLELKKLLESINFLVTVLPDIDSSAMTKIKGFASTVENGDLLLFYYCGHGTQVDETNYFIPIDDERIQTDIDIKEYGIRVDHAIGHIKEKNKSNGNIFIFDCARPYYFKDPKSSDCKYDSNMNI